MLKNLFLVVLLITSHSLFAQKFTLDGTVKDEKAIALEGATVFVLNVKDSIAIAYTITNKKGEFSLKINAEDAPKVIFKIAYLGYKTYSKDLDVPKSKVLNLGNVILTEQIEELQEISLVGKAPPVIIKKDTIEYNADSFKTLPGAKAEDLLKKLPGIEIDADGVITSNGIVVEAINVDGMRFFGEKKGEIALKNLPSDVVDKVQVTDYKSDMQKFTGEESDSGTKEINLKIKKGKNRSTFGDLKVGYTNNDRYLANANLFKVIDGEQIGAIVGTNNINSSRGFNSLPATESSNGYIESDFIGGNYTKGKWNQNRVNGNYRYSAQSRDFAKKSKRENFLPNRNYITESESNSLNNSDGHSGGLNLTINVKPKSKHSKNKVQISNNMSFNVSSNESFSNNKTTSSNTDGSLVSDYSSNNHSNSSNRQISNNIRVTPLLGNKKDFLNIGLNTSFGKSNSEAQKSSENILYNKDTTVIQDQLSNVDNNDVSVSFYTNWNKELFANFRFIPSYSVNVNRNENNNSVYDFDKTNATYSDFNTDISTNNVYTSSTVAPTLKLRYEFKNFRIETGATYKNTYRNYNDKLVEERNFKTDFNYLTYSGRIRYRDKKGYKNVTLSYNQGVGLPSISQLQPVPNVNNLLHIRTGNPDLKPSVNHSINFEYQNNLAFNNININGNLGAVFKNDKIINSTITDEDLIKRTTYDNIDGDYSYHGSARFSKAYYSNKNRININLGLSGNFNNNVSIQNEEQFVAQRTNFGTTASINYSFDNKINLSTTYGYSSIKNNYDVDLFSDTDYFVQNLRFDSAIYFFKDFFFSNRISYRYNSQVGDEFDGDVVFWNASLGTELWNKKATLTLIGYDILGKNNGFRRSVKETYIEDSESKILEQYFMLTFNYRFGTFAGQKMNSVPKGKKGYKRGRGSIKG